MNNETISRQNRVLSPIILAVTLIVIVLIMRPFYISFIEQSAVLAQGTSNLETRTKNYTDLEEIQALSESGATSDIKNKIDQLNHPFNVADIMEVVMLNDFTKTTLTGDPKISIGNISVNKGSKLPNGLSLGQVHVDVTGGDMYEVIDYITYLTTASKYAFTIDSISLPLDTDPNSQSVNGSRFGLSLSLGMYYYE